MPNYLKQKGYSHSQIKVIPVAQIIKPYVNKTLAELTSRIDELNLLTIVLRKESYVDETGFEVDEYICVDNNDLLTLLMLQKVKVVHAVILED